MKKIFSLIMLAILCFLYATDLKIQSYVDDKTISQAEFVGLNLEISGEDANEFHNYDLPKIEGLKYIRQSKSSSTSMSIINGKMTSEVKTTFKFILQPIKTGKILIPPLSLTHKGKSYSTRPIQITVSKGNQVKIQPNNRKRSSKTTNLEDHLFVEIDLKRKNVFVGETIDVSFYLYNQYNLGDLSFSENDPEFKGFWKEEIFTANRVNFDRVNYNGEIFERMLLKTYRLTPTKSGKLKIPSLEMNVGIQLSSGSFFSMGRTKDVIVKSKPKILHVSEVPTPKPDSFIGAIGLFSLRSWVSSNELKAGDSFTYTIELQGNGNFSQIDEIKLPEVQHFRFMEPEIKTEDIGNGITQRTIKYLVIPQEQGEFSIPAINFTYLDSDSKKYRTLKTKAFSMKISEGDQFVFHSGNAQNKITYEGRDIGFIITETKLKSTSSLFQNPIYYLFYFIGFGSILFCYFKGLENQKMQSNKFYSRSKQANKLIKKYLKEAERVKTDPKQFYAQIQNGLSNYICDVLRLQRGIERTELLKNLENNSLQNDIVEQVKKTMNTCDQMRFMPGSNTGDIDRFLEETKDLISNLAKNI